jgi:hypothetical protein
VRESASKSRLVVQADHYKGGGASSLLLLVPFLIYFAHDVVGGQFEQLRSEVESVSALLIAVLDINKAKSIATALDLNKLLRTQENHMKLFGQAFGAESCRPKHHYQFHVCP